MSENKTDVLQSSDAYVCESCGAPLAYKPDTESLHCGHCGSDTDIQAVVVSHVEELDFLKYAGKLEELDGSATKVIGCKKCGGESTFRENIKTTLCPYCNTPLREHDIHEERLIQPSYMLPFKVSQEAIHGHMHTWIKKLWFSPNKLKKQALHTNELKGVYVPFWTYDADTDTYYKGMRGDTYTVTTGSGKNKKTETRVRWSYRSGSVHLFFDDVLVNASRLLIPSVTKKINTWDIKNLVKTDDKFKSGFITEKYTVTLQEGFKTAKAIMESAIREAVRRDIGGDRQQINSIDTQYKDIKFKLILLPVYLSSYTYRNKLYHFYVNGCTGKITGDRPYSTWKIVFAVIAACIAAAVAYLYLSEGI